MDAYVGLDLHGDNVYCGISDENDKRLFEKRFPCDIETISRELEPYRTCLKGVAVESTFNWYWLVDGLKERGFPVRLASPSGMEQYNGLKHGNDKSDAFFLAKMMRLGILPEGYIYPKEERAVRDLLRRRMRLVQIRSGRILSLEALWNRETGRELSSNAAKTLTEKDIEEALNDKHVRMSAKQMTEHGTFLNGQIKDIEKLVLKQADLKSEFAGLLTVPGIGKILAMTIVMETGAIGRFPSPGNYASYCRTVNSELSSNGKKKGKGNTKNGNRFLAWAYVEAANFMVRHCPEAKSYFQRKMARTLRVVAIKSLAAKIAKASFFIMRDGVAFDVKKMFG
jgi:transposase